jgi:acyl-CoA thioesterase-1
MIKNPAIPFLLGVLGLVCLFAAWRPAQASVPAPVILKIMPFGDSITTSVSNTSIHSTPVKAEASYRYWLDHDLHAALIPFVFIGTQINNYGGPPKYPDFDHHNEGHSAYSAIDFLNKSDPYYIDTILSANSYGTSTLNIPDILLMHLGTNDLGQGYSPGEAVSHLGALIDHFRAINTDVVVLLAQVIPCGPTDYYVEPQDRSSCTKIPEMNALIPALAAQKNSTQSPVIVVDQYTDFNVNTDTYDALHPNQSGEIKMANKWLAAIQKWWIQSLPHHEFFPRAAK